MEMVEVSTMPIADELLVTSGKIGMELHLTASWAMILPVVVIAVVALTTVVLSAVKGLRAFRFVFTYTNLWHMFGKRGRVRVRVHSFTSTDGSNCFVTTSGEFTAELVKAEEGEDEEEDGKELYEGFKGAGALLNPGVVKGGCIVGTEMVFIYGNKSSVFATGSMVRSGKIRSAIVADDVGPSVPAWNERMLFRSLDSAAWDEILKDLRSGVTRTEKSEDLTWPGNPALPIWALCLLEPSPIQWRRFSVLKYNRGGFQTLDFSWDTILKLRLEAYRNSRTPLSSNQILRSKALVAKKDNYTATMTGNILKVWDNSSRQVLTTISLLNEESTCSLDLNTDRRIVYLGSSQGAVSLWDFEITRCVGSVSVHDGPVDILQRYTPARLAETSGLLFGSECFLTGGSPITGSANPLVLWDPRSLTGSVGSTALNRLPVTNLLHVGYELAVRDQESLLMHDFRMLDAAPILVTAISNPKLSADVGPSMSGLSTSDMENVGCDQDRWWDACSTGSTEEDDFCEGSSHNWTGQSEMLATKQSSGSVLSRCLNAVCNLRSAIC